MEMERISEATYRMLMRQGLARGLAGTRSRGTKVASAPLIGEEDDGPERSPTTRREIRVELNSGEKDGAAKPRQFTGGGQHRGDSKPLCKIQNNLNEPSSARSRPVQLTLINGGSRYNGVSKAPLYLVQP